MWPFEVNPPAAAPAPHAANRFNPLNTNDADLPELVQTTGSQWQPRERRMRLDVVLTILHVQIPRSARRQAEPLWNHLREDVIASDTALRLRQNGLRVGVGHAQWWDAMKATLDATSDVRSQSLDPVRIPPNYPLALELDEGPREQTLFFMNEDGILTGESWPQSRNALRFSYDLNLQDRECVTLLVVPEVRQYRAGWRWVRSEAGLVQLPKYGGRAFAAASFGVLLEPGEFLLIAPSEQVDLYGILGGALLSREEEGRHYDSYVFLRADVNHVARR